MNRTSSRHTTAPGRILPHALEPRRLLSAGVVDGTLRVVGSNAADAIVVYQSPAHAVGQFVVSIRERPNNAPREEFRFPMEGIASISVRGLAGDDVIRLDGLSESDLVVRIPSRIDGGLGNDLIVGTDSRDFITGGFGQDYVNARAGDDWVDGGWGRDDLNGGDGNDILSGGYGDDAVYGQAGNDSLRGGPGSDYVGSPGFASTDGAAPTQEPGDDLLLGGSGEDWVLGGAGADRVFGNAGRDHFSPLDAEPAEVRDRLPTEPTDVPTPTGEGYVTFAFRGTVTHVSPPPAGIRGGGVVDGVNWPQPGAEFRGTLTFNPIGPSTTSPAGTVTLEIDEFRWSGPASYVLTRDRPEGDSFEAGDWIPSLELVSHPEIAAFLDRWNFRLHIDGDPALLNGPRLPMTPPSLEHARAATLTLTGDSGFNTSPSPYLSIYATLDELTLAPEGPPGP